MNTELLDTGKRSVWLWPAWLPALVMSGLLCGLVWLNEALDLPHLFLGAPASSLNWREALLETAMIVVVGLISAFISVKQRQREEELYALSLVDSLTGLYSRQGFCVLGHQLLKLAKRTKKQAILLFADLDGLKQINDTLGHAAGDQALTEIAYALEQTFRESDLIARIAGDEFVVLAIGVDKPGSEVLTARLHENLETLNIIEERRYKLSLSVGVAHYDPEHPCFIGELVAWADRAMYEQKQGNQEP